jgi:hypothetical protein
VRLKVCDGRHGLNIGADEDLIKPNGWDRLQEALNTLYPKRSLTEVIADEFSLHLRKGFVLDAPLCTSCALFPTQCGLVHTYSIWLGEELQKATANLKR